VHRDLTFKNSGEEAGGPPVFSRLPWLEVREMEECVLFNEPYMYEPEYTDEELIEMDAKRSEREKKSVETAAPGDAIENRDRTSGDWWCQCRKCIQMPTEDECFCCREWDLVIPHITELELDTSFQDLDVSGHSASRDRPMCITEHPDFPPFLTCEVLETFFSFDKINWKRRPGRTCWTQRTVVNVVSVSCLIQTKCNYLLPSS